MRYDLRALARARGIRRKAVLLRPIAPPSALAGLLEAPAREIVREVELTIRAALLPVYVPRPALTQDDATSDIAAALVPYANRRPVRAKPLWPTFDVSSRPQAARRALRVGLAGAGIAASARAMQAK